MNGLTARQQEVLTVITTSIRERGFPPTLREIGARVGIRSTNGVNDHLRALERKGHLARTDMKARGLRPTGAISESESLPIDTAGIVGVPVYESVPAGVTLSENPIAETLRIDRRLTRHRQEVFGLRMRGDSMRDAGILNGDTVLVARQMSALRGEMVAVLVGDEAIVRWYFPDKDNVRLAPSNVHVPPIYVRAVDFKPTMLLGAVVGVWRAVPVSAQ